MCIYVIFNLSTWKIQIIVYLNLLDVVGVVQNVEPPRHFINKNNEEQSYVKFDITDGRLFLYLWFIYIPIPKEDTYFVILGFVVTALKSHFGTVSGIHFTMITPSSKKTQLF